MSSLIIRDVHYLYGENFEVKQGDIFISHGLVEGFYPSNKAPFTKKTEIIQGNYIAIPGFVNAHIHMMDGGQKEKWIGKSIPDLFGENGFKAKILNNSTDVQLLEETRKAWKGLLKYGITSTIVFVEEGERGLELVFKGRSQLSPKALLLGRPKKKEVLEKEIKDLLQLGDGISPSSLKNFTANDLQMICKISKKNGKLLGTHIAEVQKTGSFSKAIHDLKANFLVHGNYLTVPQLKILAEKQISLVCCIRSGRSFGIQTPDLALLDKLGLNFALGTDNLMSNSPDLFREMEFVTRELLHQHRGKLPFLPQKILQAVTINAARIGRWQNVGLIQEGYQADLLLLQKDEHLTPFQGVLTIIFRAGIQHLDWIILSGKPIQRKNL